MGGVTGEIGHQLTRLGNEHGGCLMITSQLRIFGFCVFFFLNLYLKTELLKMLPLGCLKRI